MGVKVPRYILQGFWKLLRFMWRHDAKLSWQSIQLSRWLISWGNQSEFCPWIQKWHLLSGPRTIWCELCKSGEARLILKIFLIVQWPYHKAESSSCAFFLLLILPLWICGCHTSLLPKSKTSKKVTCCFIAQIILLLNLRTILIMSLVSN